MYKKSPISNRSFNRGFKIFSKIILEPSLRVCKGVIKDVTRSQNSSGKAISASNNDISSIRNDTLSYKSPATPNQSVFDIRKRGLDQCSFINNLYYSTPRPVNTDAILPIEEILSKYLTASNKYLEKAATCGYDYYTFAKDFFIKQINAVKKETTKRYYQIASDILPIVSSSTDTIAVMEKVVKYIKDREVTQE